jgi:hypothetical protein
MERTTLFIYLLLLRAQHHMQQALREGAVRDDDWNYESFPLFYVILDGYIATIPVFFFTPPSYPTIPISQQSIEHSVSSPLSL